MAKDSNVIRRMLFFRGSAPSRFTWSREPGEPEAVFLDRIGVSTCRIGILGLWAAYLVKIKALACADEIEWDRKADGEVG